MPKYSQSVPITSELLELTRAADSLMREVVRDYMTSTPEQRAERARIAAEKRTAERADAAHVSVTLEDLAKRLGWGPRYVEHLMQPYCYCGWDIEGWSICAHAYDLGINESD